MPTPINQVKLNSTAPGESYKKVNEVFYDNTIEDINTLTKNTDASGFNAAEIQQLHALRDGHQAAFDAILQADQTACMNLEDEKQGPRGTHAPQYKGAIDPSRLIKGKKLTQDQYVALQQQAIDDVLRQYQRNFQTTLQRLQSQQEKEKREAEAQLNNYIAKVKNTLPEPKLTEFADKQRNNFLAYQQKQLNDLKALYEERQQNFLNRVKTADRDLRILQNQGKTPAEARDALVKPSVYGNAANSEIKNTLDKEFEYYSVPVQHFLLDPADPDYLWPYKAKLAMLYEKAKNAEKSSNFIAKWWHTSNLKDFCTAFNKKFGWDPLAYGQTPDEKVRFSLSISGQGNQATANVHFDTESEHIPYGQRLGAWNTSLDKLISQGKESFNLMWAKLSFPLTPESQRYDAALTMAKHIWAQNPNATIEPGFLPPDYQMMFNELKVKANRGEIQAQSRIRNGLPKTSPRSTTVNFDVPQLIRPGTTFEGVNGLSADRNRSIAFGAARSPIHTAGSNVPSRMQSGGASATDNLNDTPTVRIGPKVS